jgi:hypothetical protein
MTVEVLGRTMRRDTVEALIEAMIEALNASDGDSDAESEHDEDDCRWLEKLTSESFAA